MKVILSQGIYFRWECYCYCSKDWNYHPDFFLKLKDRCNIALKETFTEAFTDAFPKAFVEALSEVFPEAFSYAFSKGFSKTFPKLFPKALPMAIPKVFPQMFGEPFSELFLEPFPVPCSPFLPSPFKLFKICHLFIGSDKYWSQYYSGRNLSQTPICRLQKLSPKDSGRLQGFSVWDRCQAVLLTTKT